MKEIAPGIFVEAAYPPYNVTLISTSRGGIIVDIPPRTSHAQAWLEQVSAITHTIRYVILTDASRDRLLGLVGTELPVASTETVLRLTLAWEERPWREFLQDMAAQYQEEAGEIIRLKPRKPTLAFGGSLVISCGSQTVRLESVAGAAPGSLWVDVPSANLLIAGDTVVVEEPPPMDHTPDSKAWLDTLATLSRRAVVQRVVPGRGSAPLLRGAIEQQRELLRIMRRTARSLAKGTMSNSSITQTAQDVGQAFFNATGQRAVKRIKAGLEHLVLEVHKHKLVDTGGLPDYDDEA
jgi:glyoxylase-like metal-dependent hydrolase (beta-lactamase superfamily II)